VLDVLMPGVSGDAVAEQIHVAHPGLPVLLVTGSYGTSFAATAPAPILRKPFPPEELVRAVRALLEG
jgi:DNA-binding NtrC family response regulator